MKTKKYNHNKNQPYPVIYVGPNVVMILPHHFQGSAAEPTANKRRLGFLAVAQGPEKDSGSHYEARDLPLDSLQHTDKDMFTYGNYTLT